MEFDAWAERFWDPRGRFVVAYPVEGSPRAAGDGREAILANMRGLAKAVGRIATSDLQVHQTLDPDFFVVAYKMHADYPGGSYDNDILSLVRLRDGKIAEPTEYYDVGAYARFLRGIQAAA